MQQSSYFPVALAEEVIRATPYSAPTPRAFFDAYKRGVRLAGIGLFGAGTQEAFDRATRKEDLAPNVELISTVVGSMSRSDQQFVVALASFHADGASLFQQAGLRGFAGLQGMDTMRRSVIAALILYLND